MNDRECTHIPLSIKAALHSHRIEKERLRAEQEQKGQPRHVAQIRRARTSLPEQDLSEDQVSTPLKHQKAHPTSLSSLCPTDAASSINIICCWTAIVGGDGQDNVTPGQHHLRDLIVRPRTNESRKGSPLVLTARYDSRLVHDFNSGPVVRWMAFIYLRHETLTPFLAGEGLDRHNSQ